MPTFFAHTPTYVWAILAALVALGLLAMREREMPVRRLGILPLAMTALSLNDLGNRFGIGAFPLGAWSVACVAAAATMVRFGRARLAAAATPGRVKVGASVAPLAIMMTVFCIRYATAVMLALHPHLAGAALAIVPVCGAGGAISGILLGRMARDLADCRALGRELAARPSLPEARVTPERTGAA